MGQLHIAKQIVQIVRQVGSDKISLMTAREHLCGPLENPRDFSIHFIDARQIQLPAKPL
jgi:hypothetical protein